MLFPFCVKNNFMSVKKTASFKTRHLAVECIQLGGLCYARVTMPLIVVSDENLHYIMYVCLSLSDNEQLRDGN